MIEAEAWVAIAFVLFLGLLVYGPDRSRKNAMETEKPAKRPSVGKGQTKTPFDAGGYDEG